MKSAFREEFIKLYNRDIPSAKYKLGQRVRYKQETPGVVAILGCGTILAINDTGDGIEYAVDKLDCLLWESEILETL